MKLPCLPKGLRFPWPDSKASPLKGESPPAGDLEGESPDPDTTRLPSLFL